MDQSELVSCMVSIDVRTPLLTLFGINYQWQGISPLTFSDIFFFRVRVGYEKIMQQ